MIEGKTRRPAYGDPDATNVEERSVSVDAKRQKQAPPQGKFFKFENIGDSVEGTVTEFFAGEYKNKPTKNVKLKLANGKEVSFRLSQQLEENFSDVEGGEEVKMVYTGKQHTGTGRAFKTFDFYKA